MRTKHAILLGIVVAAATCALDCRDGSMAAKWPEITSESKEGIYDLVFGIQDHHQLADGAQRIRAAGSYQSQILSFEVKLEPSWRRETLGEGLNLVVYRGAVAIRSVGSQSDDLLRVIDQLYKANLAPQKMNPSTAFTAISLEGNPGQLGDGPVKIKLFFEGVNERGYAELFLNIDLPARKLHLNEKDTGYRQPVVRALAES